MSDKIITPEELEKMIKKDDPDYVAPKREKIIDINKPTDKIDIKQAIPLTFSDIQKDTPKPIEFIFIPCLAIQGTAFIYAPTGLGKTFFTLNLAYAIAGGGNFLKYSCPKPRKVLYVDAEMAYNQIHARIINISKQQGDLYFEENFSLITRDKINFPIPQIDEKNGQQFYLDQINEHKYEVVVFDNLSTLTCFDENKANEWKPIQKFLLQLRTMGVSTICVHHAGKAEGTYRGTSKMTDCVDVVISLESIDKEIIEENYVGTRFNVVYKKNRLFSGKDAASFETAYNGNEWICKSMNQSDLDKVVEKFKCNMSQRDIAQEMKCSQSKVNKLIKKATMMRLIP